VPLPIEVHAGQRADRGDDAQVVERAALLLEEHRQPVQELPEQPAESVAASLRYLQGVVRDLVATPAR